LDAIVDIEKNVKSKLVTRTEENNTVPVSRHGKYLKTRKKNPTFRTS